MDTFYPLNPDTAYLLGYYCADGNVTINKNGSCYLEFTSTDKEHLEAIKARFGLTQTIGLRRGTGEENDRYRIQIGSKSLVAELIKLGLGQRKSSRMSLPFIYK